jgi:predicted dehydrogenase
MSTSIRWGILGTGNIARQFAAGVASSQRTTLGAVGSRSQASATEFAQTYQIPASFGSYDQVLRDPEVDAIYISLPNSLHHEWTTNALQAGKHVLCEKPLAASARQAMEMFTLAQKTGLVLVEAFMYLAHPLTAAILQTARSGAIGQIKLIRTSFCYRTTRMAGNIRFSPELSGGALMDIGCYCISFSSLIADRDPQSVHAFGRLHPSGVDEMAVGQMDFGDGLLASFTCGMGVQVDNSAYICGDEGYIEIPIPWKPPATGATYIIARGTPPKMDSPNAKSAAAPPREARTVDAGKDLYAVEADAFAAAVLDSAPPFMTQAQSIANMRILDELRRQIGIEVKP